MIFDRSRVCLGSFLHRAGKSHVETSPILVWSASVGEFVYCMSNVGKGMELFRRMSFTCVLGPLPREQLQNLSKAALYHVNSLTPDGISRLMTFLATQSHCDKKVLSRYCERLVDSKFAGFSGREVAMILNGLVRLDFVDRGVFTLASSYLRKLPLTEFVCERDLGLIHNAFAKGRIRDEELFKALLPRVEHQLTVMSPQTCGNICHAYGKLEIRSGASNMLLVRIARHVVNSNHHRVASSQELSNIMYSFGNLGISEMTVIDPLLRVIETKIRRFNPVELAALATALSKLNMSNKVLMRLLSKQVQSVADKFDAYEITAVLHAFSHLDFISVPINLFETIAPSVFLNSSKINSHTACIAYCAYARVEVDIPVGLESQLLDLIITENDPQYLVNVIFAMSKKLAPVNRNLLTIVSEKLSRKKFPINPINLTQLIYALDSSYPLYRESLLMATPILNIFTPVQFANILHAIAPRASQLCPEERDFLSEIVTHADRFVPDLTHQLLCSVAESAARLELVSLMQFVQQQNLKLDEWGVGTLCALSHSGMLTAIDDITSTESLDGMQICRLLAAIRFSNFAIPPLMAESVIQYLRDACEEISSAELIEILTFMKSFGIDVPPPFNIVPVDLCLPVSPMEYSPPVGGPLASVYISNLTQYDVA